MIESDELAKIACVACGFRGLWVYGEGNHGKGNEKKTARAGKIKDAAGRGGKCRREKPSAAKPSVNVIELRP